MSNLKLRTPYITPFFRSFLYGTNVADEEALDRSAPPEYWKHALTPSDYEQFCKNPAALMPWLSDKEKTL